MYSDTVMAAVKNSDGRFKHMKHAKAGTIPAFGQTIAWPTTATDFMVLVLCIGSVPATLRFEDLRLTSLHERRYKYVSVRYYNGRYQMTNSQSRWVNIDDAAVREHALEDAFRVSVFEWTTCPTPEHKSMQMAYQRLKSQQDFQAGSTNCEMLHNASRHKQLPQAAAQIAIRGINSQTLLDYRTLQLSLHTLAVNNADEIIAVHTLQERLD